MENIHLVENEVTGNFILKVDLTGIDLGHVNWI
jgi:hypothetical protein